MSELSLGIRVSNVKSVALTVLELLAFNAQKIGGHVILATPAFGKIFGFMSGLSLGTCESNLRSVALTVLELLAFNSHRSAAHTHRHTDRHTSNEHTISAIHFVHLAKIMNERRMNEFNSCKTDRFTDTQTGRERDKYTLYSETYWEMHV